jgi:hypothetical protein
LSAIGIEQWSSPTVRQALQYLEEGKSLFCRRNWQRFFTTVLPQLFVVQKSVQRSS